MLKRRAFREDGQILIIVATAFFFVLIGAAATTVDLGNGMVQQRRLQNVSDAAAVAAAAEMSRGGTSSTAIAVAKDVVSSNTGGAVTIPSTNTGSGEGLTAGIELNQGPNGTEVRVALQRQVNTFLAGVIGVKTMNIHARSRAGTRYQGIMPVAVKRFTAGDTSMDISASNPRRVGVQDAVASVGTGSLASWPSPLSASAVNDIPATPNATAAAAAAGSSVCAASAGLVIPFLGRDAQANVANGNDFHFWIAPDIRNITSMSPQYYNGVTGTTSAQNLKNLETLYFGPSGYPTDPPVVGDELAAMSGTNDAQTVQQIRKSFWRGSIVTALLYDGTVYRKTDFNIQVPASVTSATLDPLTATKSVTFPVALSTVNGFSDNIVLAVDGLSVGDGTNDWHYQFSNGPQDGTDTVYLSGSQTVYLKIWPNSAFQGAKTIQVKAYSTTREKTAATTAVAGNNQVFSITTGESYKVVSFGSATDFAVVFTSWNNYGPSNVHISSVSGPGVSFPPDLVTVKRNRPGWELVHVDLSSTVVAAGEYTLKVTASDDSSPTQTQDLYLTLIVIPDPATNVSQTTSYVNVLGYANFQITYANNDTTPSSDDTNTIYACAISDIVADPSLLTKGMVPRLLPWR